MFVSETPSPQPQLVPRAGSAAGPNHSLPPDVIKTVLPMILGVTLIKMFLTLVIYPSGKFIGRVSLTTKGLKEDSMSVQSTNPNPTWVGEIIPRQYGWLFAAPLVMGTCTIRRRLPNVGMDIPDDQGGDQSDWLPAGVSAAGSDLPPLTPNPATSSSDDSADDDLDWPQPQQSSNKHVLRLAKDHTSVSATNFDPDSHYANGSAAIKPTVTRVEPPQLASLAQLDDASHENVWEEWNAESDGASEHKEEDWLYDLEGLCLYPDIGALEYMEYIHYGRTDFGHWQPWKPDIPKGGIFRRGLGTSQ